MKLAVPLRSMGASKSKSTGTGYQTGRGFEPRSGRSQCRPVHVSGRPSGPSLRPPAARVLLLAAPPPVSSSRAPQRRASDSGRCSTCAAGSTSRTGRRTARRAAPSPVIRSVAAARSSPGAGGVRTGTTGCTWRGRWYSRARSRRAQSGRYVPCRFCAPTPEAASCLWSRHPIRSRFPGRHLPHVGIAAAIREGGRPPDASSMTRSFFSLSFLADRDPEQEDCFSPV